MLEENKNLNGGSDSTTDNGTKANESVVPTDETANKLSELTQTVDNLAIALTKAQSDSENYKQGMLVAKQKLKENGFDDEPDTDKITETVSRILDEKLNPIIAKINNPEKDNLIVKAQKSIDELKLALNNRSQISNTAGGSNIDGNPEVKNNYFSESQLEDLKKKGLDPKKVEENMKKYRGQI